MTKKAVYISCFGYYEHRIRLIEQVLCREGYECTFITADFDHIEKQHIQQNFPYIHPISTMPYQKNLSAARILSHIHFARDAMAEVEKIRPDLLYVMVPPNSMAHEAAKYKKLHPDVHLIMDLYDLWPETFPNNRAKKLLAVPFALWRNRRDHGLSAADVITTECALYQQVLRKQLAGKHVELLPLCRPGITATVLHPPREDRLELCYLGSINNIIDISAISDLISGLTKCKPVVLHIIGDGESRQALIASVEKAGAQVVYHGKIYDAQEKQAIFDGCHFGINMMKRSVCVGLTMKSLDYFAGGLPILNTIGGDTFDLVAQQGIGINVERNHISESAVRIAAQSAQENVQMRKKVVEVFEARFTEAIFEETFRRIIRSFDSGQHE